jgi:hypothetical protein
VGTTNYTPNHGNRLSVNSTESPQSIGLWKAPALKEGPIVAFDNQRAPHGVTASSFDLTQESKLSATRTRNDHAEDLRPPNIPNNTASNASGINNGANNSTDEVDRMSPRHNGALNRTNKAEQSNAKDRCYNGGNNNRGVDLTNNTPTTTNNSTGPRARNDF